MSRAAWQLPRGVSRGTWNYVQTTSIASDYDRYFENHPLMLLDMQIVQRHLPPIPLESRSGQHGDSRPLVADFGCGTGRVAAQICPLGYRTLNVDLSQHMLTVARSKFEPAVNSAAFVHGNLVQLQWLRSQTLDMAVCLFSSVGMIRGCEHRRTFLRQVRHSLKPEAKFILHVHNRYHSWLDPHGPWWLISTWLRSCFDRNIEMGDRVYTYRGLPTMFLHIYSRTELLSDLKHAGFTNVELFPINRTGDQILKANLRFQELRAGGYFAICEAS